MGVGHTPAGSLAHGADDRQALHEWHSLSAANCASLSSYLPW